MRTKIGKQRGASHWAASNPGKYLFTHLAVGTGTTAATVNDLALDTETYRVVLDTVYQDDVVCLGKVVITASDIGSGTITIAELGLYDAASGGNLIARAVLATAVTFTGAERLEVIWGLVIE